MIAERTRTLRHAMQIAAISPPLKLCTCCCPEIAPVGLKVADTVVVWMEGDEGGKVGRGEVSEPVVVLSGSAVGSDELETEGDSLVAEGSVDASEGVEDGSEDGGVGVIADVTVVPVIIVVSAVVVPPLVTTVTEVMTLEETTTVVCVAVREGASVVDVAFSVDVVDSL